MNKLIIILTFLFPPLAFGQTVVTGNVTGEKGEPLPGTNVFIENTFDGSSTDALGSYSFQTNETGAQTLHISFIGYEEQSVNIILSGQKVSQNFQLKEEIDRLEGVTITAGVFEAGDVKRSAALTSMDVATTAGALADISAAVQTLPGTTTVGESGRLYVRGGDAEETNIYIDGMWVPTPYLSTAPNIGTRGRFNPFLFSGTVFSTGGYSAEYGQALSSVLLLNTSNLKEQDELNIALFSLGADVTATKRWEKQALTVTANYFNLKPYLAIAKSNQNFSRAPMLTSNELSFKRKTGKYGMLKVYSNLNHNRLTLKRKDLNTGGQSNFDLSNINYFLNASWRGSLSEKWALFTGADFQINKDDIGIQTDDFKEKTKAAHFKTTLDYDHNNMISFRFGVEQVLENFKQSNRSKSITYRSEFKEMLSSAFAEANIYMSNKFVMRPGIRAEYSNLLGQANIAPRFSAAYKSHDHGQFSLAMGQFYQKPFRQDLLIDSNLDFQRADHYTLNYQWVKNDRIFRSEVYYKNYQALTKYDSPNRYSNSGNGYAYGLDIFYRDNKTVKDGHFWISYSYLQTERDYQNFPVSAVPTFATDHSLSLVYKHWFPVQRMMLGADFNIASARKYNDPNMEAFNAAEMPINHNLNLNIAYAMKDQLFFYAAATNVLGRKNQFGFEYASQPNAAGVYESEPIRGFSDRFFVLGFFTTFSKGNTKNQLDKIN